MNPKFDELGTSNSLRNGIALFCMQGVPMTVREAANFLGVSQGIVYALCASGKLEHERYGIGRGTIRIWPEALASFRASSRRHVGEKVPSNPIKRHPAECYRQLDASRMLAEWRKRGVAS